MLRSILGKKLGMTQVFDSTGNIKSVTVIEAGPCIVTGLRTLEKDGYKAIQIGLGEIKEKSLSKPLLGQFKKNNIAYKKYLREFRVDDISNYQLGQEVKVDIFKEGDYVDITGTSRGKGYAGAVKRHGFGGGPVTHGQSDRLRAVGSLGGQRPQRVFRGQRLPGHLGNERITIQNLKVYAVYPEKNIILVEGAVPGVKGGLLEIKSNVKKIKSKVIKAQPDKAKKGK